MITVSSVTDAVDGIYEGLFAGTTGVVAFAIYVLVAVALWKVFSKAGYPGFFALIPILNLIILVKIAGMSAWLTLLYLIPIVGFIFHIVVSVKVGDRFGKGGAFSFFLLWLLPFIGYFILGFGEAKYRRA